MSDNITNHVQFHFKASVLKYIITSLYVCVFYLFQVPFDHLEFDKDFLEGKTKIEQPKTVAEVLQSSVSVDMCIGLVEMVFAFYETDLFLKSFL